MLTTEDIAGAADRIGPHIERTPLIVSAPMSTRTGSTVAIKAEHLQRTGSFKLRGALNRVLTASPGQGIVTASSGNHGIATATAAREAGVACTVFLPTGAAASKVAAIDRLGAEIVTVDSTDAFQAEVAARTAAERDGVVYVSPYNDEAVMAGQGTVGREIDADAAEAGLGRIDAVVVAVGGGGLISGVATWLTEARPGIAVIGASPANDAAMVASIAAGAIIDVEGRPTFSDGTAGGIESDSATFEVCRDRVTEWATVSEVEIADAVAAMIDDHHQLVEGAAGVALAAAERWAGANRGSTVVAVSCGANTTAANLEQMLALRSLDR